MAGRYWLETQVSRISGGEYDAPAQALVFHLNGLIVVGYSGDGTRIFVENISPAASQLIITSLQEEDIGTYSCSAGPLTATVIITMNRKTLWTFSQMYNANSCTAERIVATYTARVATFTFLTH